MQVPGGPTKTRGMERQRGAEHTTTLKSYPMRRAGGSIWEFELRHILSSYATQNDPICGIAEYLSPSVGLYHRRGISVSAVDLTNACVAPRTEKF
jgi:hypothetical protein